MLKKKHCFCFNFSWTQSYRYHDSIYISTYTYLQQWIALLDKTNFSDVKVPSCESYNSNNYSLLYHLLLRCSLSTCRHIFTVHHASTKSILYLNIQLWVTAFDSLYIIIMSIAALYSSIIPNLKVFQ